MRRFNLWLTAGVVTLALAGCASPSRGPVGFAGIQSSAGGETRLRIGDQIQVRLETVSSQQPQQIDTTVDENGEISLPLVGRIKAEGFTPSELAERIQANYVPRYYIRCNATVLTSIRFFYVGGEVRSQSRYNWSEDITLLKAINTAGGFTDYANRRRVEVSRGKEKKTFDAEDLRQHPDRDFPIQPGDSIYIPRSIF
jgi:polysaccharide export outer membrane protein